MFAYEYEVMRELRKKTKLILPISDVTADVFTQLFCLLLLTITRIIKNYWGSRKALVQDPISKDVSVVQSMGCSYKTGLSSQDSHIEANFRKPVYF